MKQILLLMLFVGMVLSAQSQKIAFVDSEYILKNIPAYETANEQLNLLAKKYEGEIKAKFDEVASLYETYKNESVFLAADMKVKRRMRSLRKNKQPRSFNNSILDRRAICSNVVSRWLNLFRIRYSMPYRLLQQRRVMGLFLTNPQALG